MIFYVALTELDKGGGPKIGSRRLDVAVDVPSWDKAEGVAKQVYCDLNRSLNDCAKRLEQVYVFGVYKGTE